MIKLVKDVDNQIHKGPQLTRLVTRAKEFKKHASIMGRKINPSLMRNESKKMAKQKDLIFLFSPLTDPGKNLEE